MKQPIATLSFIIFVFLALITVSFFLAQKSPSNTVYQNAIVVSTTTPIFKDAQKPSVVFDSTSTTPTVPSVSNVVHVSAHDPLQDDFNYTSILEETGSPVKSSDPYWWVNSGAYLYVNNGVASTIKGSLASSSKWRLDYENYNSAETDNGFHPQNIFRLVHLYKIKDYTQQTYFRIVANNLSSDSHRAGSNGLFLFNRYQDGDNVYYTGLRVDGYAVIKKKIKGQYYTMALSSLSLGSTYNRQTNPNLLPKNTWIGLRSVVGTTIDNKVEIKLYSDIGDTGSWKLVASTTDDGVSFGGLIISDAGYTGIRTDFMNVEFKDYTLTEIKE